GASGKHMRVRFRETGALALALIACGGGSGGGDGAGGAGGGGAGAACTPACASLHDDPVRAICLEGSCVDVGLRDDAGEVRLSSVMVYARLPAGAIPTIRSYSTTAYHPLRPDGSSLSCADLLALPPEARRDTGALNVVAWHGNGFLAPPAGDTIPSPLSNVPVNEPGVRYLLLSELYSGAPDSTTRLPTGALVAHGCIEGFEAPEGRYADHE